MEAHIRPTPASFSPSAARMNTDITNALEMGFQSEMPWEMPLTRTNTKQSASATIRKNTGWCSSWWPRKTVAAPQNRIQRTSRTMLTRFQSGASATGAPDSRMYFRTAWMRMRVISSPAAPRMVPRAMMKPILR